jgi:hypothetical protein
VPTISESLRARRPSFFDQGLGDEGGCHRGPKWPEIGIVAGPEQSAQSDSRNTNQSQHEGSEGAALVLGLGAHGRSAEQALDRRSQPEQGKGGRGQQDQREDVPVFPKRNPCTSDHGHEQ